MRTTDIPSVLRHSYSELHTGTAGMLLRIHSMRSLQGSRPSGMWNRLTEQKMTETPEAGEPFHDKM